MTKATMALVFYAAGTVAYAAQPQQKLTVYLRNTANVDGTARIQAKDLASRMFAQIGIALDWREWRKGVPEGDPSERPIFIELATDTPHDRLPGALAFALAFEGSHITVFADRIENNSARSRVLGHVMVHEITHLLQGTDGHSATGIMKARWTLGDYAVMRCRPLPFASENVDLIYAGLAKRTAKGALADTR